MSVLIKRLANQGLIHPPKWLPENTHYLTQMGSVAYGCSTDSSDIDVFGFCLPPIKMIFPHLDGEIPGFGTQLKRFNVWQEHHVKTDRKEYDFSVHSIVRFFHLCLENNPNTLDSLFAAERSVLHITKIGLAVREKRKIFLSKQVIPKFRGYANSQKSKILTKQPELGTKRAEDVAKYGFDLKFAMHLIRLMLECEQILMRGDLDITQDREIYKAIRRGEWSYEKVMNFYEEKNVVLEELYLKSDLPVAPNEEQIKSLLVDCLEMHYGSISQKVSVGEDVDRLVSQIQDVINSYQKVPKNVQEPS